jgi:hypothetical protein
MSARPTRTEPLERAPEFYVGYLARGPRATMRRVRWLALGFGCAALCAAVVLARALEHPGDGHFAWGETHRVQGTLCCADPARACVAEGELLLVGSGKHSVPDELAEQLGQSLELRGARIERDGVRVLELADRRPSELGAASPGVPHAARALGRMQLTGEIVDSKCYFGVMNPGEGRAHRACAILCLRGGIPAVFVARDRGGARAHLLLLDERGARDNLPLLPWVGEPVQLEGEVWRRGAWLELWLAPGSIRHAARATAP